MAAQSKLFQRLIWLVDTIYSAGHISRGEIDRRWATSRHNDIHDMSTGNVTSTAIVRPLSRCLAEILCAITPPKYSIGGLDEVNGSGMRSWLMNSFAINNMVNLGGGIKDRTTPYTAD